MRKLSPSSKMTTTIARLLAFLAAASMATAAEAAVIYVQGTFVVDYHGQGDEPGDSYDPPLLGPGSFVLRSEPFYPGNEFPDPAFEVLEFGFAFLGRSWDESDVSWTDCWFWPDGTPDGINIAWDDPDSTDRWHLSWNFSDGNFGFLFNLGGVSGSGSSESGTAGGAFDEFDVQLVPEPGTAALLALGLMGMVLGRRRRA